MPSQKKRLFPPYLQHPELKQSQDHKCPVCRTGSADFFSGVVSAYAVGDHGPKHEILQGWCDTCTNFVITREAVEAARAKKKTHLLCAFLRQLPDQPWEKSVGKVVLQTGNWEEFVSSITPLSVSEQFDEAIAVVCHLCPGIGQASSFAYMTDWPLWRTESQEAALFIMRELANDGFIFKDRDGMPQLPPAPTWKAYQRLEQLETSGKNSNRAFVAMSFDPSQEEIWSNVIKPAIEAAGYLPKRVDKEEHSERIDDYIISQIRRCRFLVADFTQQKKGVYFEAGMALGLGRTVIWMCHDSDKQNLHFDTRQFNHIMYTDHETARKQLTNRIVALEGQGPYTADPDI